MNYFAGTNYIQNCKNTFKMPTIFVGKLITSILSIISNEY